MVRSTTLRHKKVTGDWYAIRGQRRPARLRWESDTRRKKFTICGPSQYLGLFSKLYHSSRNLREWLSRDRSCTTLHKTSVIPAPRPLFVVRENKRGAVLHVRMAIIKRDIRVIGDATFAYFVLKIDLPREERATKKLRVEPARVRTQCKERRVESPPQRVHKSQQIRPNSLPGFLRVRCRVDADVAAVQAGAVPATPVKCQTSQRVQRRRLNVIADGRTNLRTPLFRHRRGCRLHTETELTFVRGRLPAP